MLVCVQRKEAAALALAAGAGQKWAGDKAVNSGTHAIAEVLSGSGASWADHPSLNGDKCNGWQGSVYPNAAMHPE